MRSQQICGGKDSIGLVVDCAGAPISMRQGMDMLRNNGQLIRIGMGFKPLNYDIKRQYLCVGWRLRATWPTVRYPGQTALHF